MGDSNPEGFSYQAWHEPLKDISKKVISLDMTKYFLLNGKNKLNKEVLRLTKKEKPNYLFLGLNSPDYIYLDTLLEIKIISPKTKLVSYASDDDTLFETFSRYCSLFVDYSLIDLL